MKRSLVTAAVFALALTLLPAGSSSAVSLTVEIADNSYTPDHATSPVLGLTGTWHNGGTTNHSATANAPFKVFNTGTIAPGGNGFIDTSLAGTYEYHCTFHSGMKGTLRVPLETSINPSVEHEKITVTIATAAIPKGLYFQVQARRGTAAWGTIFEGRAKTFEHDFNHSGAWQLHARLVHRNSGDVSKWSPLYDQTVNA